MVVALAAIECWRWLTCSGWSYWTWCWVLANPTELSNRFTNCHVGLVQELLGRDHGSWYTLIRQPDQLLLERSQTSYFVLSGADVIFPVSPLSHPRSQSFTSRSKGGRGASRRRTRHRRSLCPSKRRGVHKSEALVACKSEFPELRCLELQLQKTI